MNLVRLILTYKLWVALEFKLADFWIGVFWKKDPLTLDVWVCLIPCFPIHLYYWDSGPMIKELKERLPMSPAALEAWQTTLKSRERQAVARRVLFGKDGEPTRVKVF